MKAALVGILFLTSINAFAGKMEREFVKSKLDPSQTKALAAYKVSCQCELKVSYNADAFKTTGELDQVSAVFDQVAEGAPTYCTDEASRKAICKMKNLEVVQGSNPKFSFAGSKGTATVSADSFITWSMMTKELDK